MYNIQQLNIYLVMTAKALGSKVFEDRSSVQQLMAANNPLFNERMKRIVNKNFVAIKESGVFERRNIPTPNLFYFTAVQYRSQMREDIEDYMLNQIQHFYSNFQGSYALVYVHSSLFDFIAFRKMIQKWPEHFFHRLRRVYILSPSVMVKLIETISFGTFYHLCDELFHNIDSDQQLLQQDTDLLKHLGQNPTPTKTPAFKNSIKIIESDLYGKTLEQYDLFSGRYPLIMLQLLARLLKDPNELRAEGIFRKSCDSDELQRLEKQLGRKELGSIGRETDIFVVCGCLKKIMNNLRHPLFSYAIYQQVIDFQVGDELTFIRGIFSQMEYVNYKVFVLLVVFLTDYIIAQKEYNKMSGYNLAVVFGPCFFRPQEYDLKDLIYSGKFAKILVTAFEKPTELIEAAQIMLARGTLQQLRKGNHNW